MTSISPKQKERLQNALDRITDECTNGSDPNDAIIKVAKDLDLHEDELPLLVRGYNVGATNAQWKSSKDQQIKLAEFPIADIDIINSRLYPNQVKTASVRKQKTDNTFMKSASSIFDGCFKKEYNYDALPMIKSAEKHSREDDTRAFFAKEDAILQQIHHIQDAYMLKKYAAKKDFDEKVEAFADCLQDPYAPELEKMKKDAQAIHGDSGELLIRYTLERFPAITNRPRVIKSAEALSVDSKFYKTMDSALKALDLFVKTDLQEKQACAKCASALEPIAKGRKEAVYGDEMDQALLSPEEVYDNQMKKEAGDLTPSLSDYISRTPGPSWEMADPIERSALKELADRSPLRNQKVRALLLDLMSSDPYLRQQDPDVIAAAFNDLYEANPTDALKRIWLKTHLPQYIASESLDAPMVSNMIESGRSAEKAENERIKSLFDQFMNSVNLKEKEEGLKREKDRDAFQRELAEYQKQQDADRAKYQKERDKKLDDRYKKEYDDKKKDDKYRKAQDKARFDYQKERDSIMDDRNYQMDAENRRATRVREQNQKAEFDYRKGRDEAKDQEQLRKDQIAELKEQRLEKERADRNKITDQRYAEGQEERATRKLEAEAKKLEIDEARKKREQEAEDRAERIAEERRQKDLEREQKHLDSLKFQQFQADTKRLEQERESLMSKIQATNRHGNTEEGRKAALNQLNTMLGRKGSDAYVDTESYFEDLRRINPNIVDFPGAYQANAMDLYDIGQYLERKNTYDTTWRGGPLNSLIAENENRIRNLNGTPINRY